jgi:hypothetical protein
MATLRAALDGLLGRPLEVRISVEGGRTGSPPAEPDERDTDLMRYAIDRLP